MYYTGESLFAKHMKLPEANLDENAAWTSSEEGAKDASNAAVPELELE